MAASGRTHHRRRPHRLTLDSAKPGTTNRPEGCRAHFLKLNATGTIENTTGRSPCKRESRPMARLLSSRVPREIERRQGGQGSVDGPCPYRERFRDVRDEGVDRCASRLGRNAVASEHGETVVGEEAGVGAVAAAAKIENPHACTRDHVDERRQPGSRLTMKPGVRRRRAIRRPSVCNRGQGGGETVRIRQRVNTDRPVSAVTSVTSTVWLPRERR